MTRRRLQPERRKRQHSDPHDALIKEILSRPREAALLFRLVIPADQAREIRWDRLARQEDSGTSTGTSWPARDGQSLEENSAEYIRKAVAKATVEPEARARAAAETRGRAAAIAKGRAEGLAKGRAEERAEARATTLAEMLLKQLTLKFGRLPAHAQRRVRGARVAQLERWIERVVEASTLGMVIGSYTVVVPRSRRASSLTIGAQHPRATSARELARSHADRADAGSR